VGMLFQNLSKGTENKPAKQASKYNQLNMFQT
jgi:hypothetical protein